jgi:hypothetical protein
LCEELVCVRACVREEKKKRVSYDQA